MRADAPLVDSTIIHTVSYVAPQLYNNPMPLKDVSQYLASLQRGAVVNWDGQDLRLNIPSRKLVLGYPAAPGAAPNGPSQPWEWPPSSLAAYYRASPSLLATGGVMTWSVGWDESNGWQWIDAVTSIWPEEQRLVEAAQADSSVLFNVA